MLEEKVEQSCSDESSDTDNGNSRYYMPSTRRTTADLGPQPNLKSRNRVELSVSMFFPTENGNPCDSKTSPDATTNGSDEFTSELKVTRQNY